jgi:hypothetical protein
MEKDKNIQYQIESSFNAISDMDPVAVSPFLKQKIMQQLFIEKEKEAHIWTWFTPKWQLTILVCLMVINVFALFHVKPKVNKYEANIILFSKLFDLEKEAGMNLFK